jgi:predicted AlkP superfamily pyrophosphatase or phosphodiesterase
MNTRTARTAIITIAAAWIVAAGAVHAAPKVVVISLDGAKPGLIESYLKSGVLDKKAGLGRLERRGIVAERNITATPSVTAVAHIAIATGSTAVHNDIPANTFHPVGATITTPINGFGAPIGGYQISPLAPSSVPTAEPLWVQLRATGKKVVTATWPGSDGADIRIAGTLVQAAEPTRTTDYTVPFGAFGGLGAQGFVLAAGSFVAADAALVAQLAAAGKASFSPVRVAVVETVFCSPTTGNCGTSNAEGRTLRYDIRVAALDRTDDAAVNYDTLALFDSNAGVAPGPFALPATGPAYARSGGPSARFFFEGSGNRIGAAYFVSHLAPDLSSARFARYAANFIPRNAAVLGVVDDINSNVGFWAPQPDFRIPERLSPGFTDIPDLELEAMYQDQVRTFVDYQTRIGLRAIERNPDADLVMIYIEQPDGAGHQFTLTDPRQPTNFLDKRSIGTPGNPPGAIGQDKAKVARYDAYLKFAYQQANAAVEAIVDAVGTNRRGEPKSDVFVVSDHGMAPFHTAVNLRNLLAGAGIDIGGTVLGIRSTGPAAHVYVNLQGREPGGTVTPSDYRLRVGQIAAALQSAKDPNAYYNPKAAPLFSHVWTRPDDCGNPGFCVDENIGQDSGDVFALMAEGYNFDGTQTPVVARLGDTDPAVSAVYSVPNFYGAHGHDSELESMSAILYAAGPNVRNGGRLERVRNIDLAPTVMKILGVKPAPTVDGVVIERALKRSGEDGRERD